MNKLLIPLLVTGCGVIAWSQGGSARDSEAPIPGPQLFKVYCAGCHGIDAKGKGPAAAAMRASMPDLTLLSKKNGGKFPLMQVEQAIDGREGLLPHGSVDMPVYGELFEGIRRDDAFVTQRIDLLTGYIESLQVK